MKKKYFWILFFCLSIPKKLRAQDETWVTFAAQTKLSQDYYLVADYVRRDRADTFNDRFRDMVRAYVGADLGDFSFWMGGAYADFADQVSEHRIIQQAIYNIKNSNKGFNGFARIGLEQRKFDQDDSWYFRLRARVLLTFFESWLFSPTFYDESNFGFQGREKFKNGFNENRFASGFKIVVQDFETSILWVNTTELSVEGLTSHSDWLQLQLSHEF